MNADLLAEISATEGAEHAVILTHNIDFLFLESVVLGALRQAGQPSLTVFADMSCCAETYRRQRAFIQGLGRRYRVVQTGVTPGFRFHPKAVLLVGQRVGRLWVGSGNLTFGGWRENAEVWAGFDAEQDGSGPFIAFAEYLRRVLQRVPLSAAIEEFVVRAFAPEHHPWLDAGAQPSHVLGRAAVGEPSILEQMMARQEAAVERIEVVCPYFDDGLEAATRLAKIAPARVNLHPTQAAVVRDAFDKRPPELEFQCARAPRSTGTGDDKDPFIHAKAYVFQHVEGRSSAFIGSANCSYAGLLASGHMGNAELMVQVDAGADALLQGLHGEPGEPRLVDPPPGNDDEPEDSGHQIAVAGARLERDRLRVAVRASEGVAVQELLIDGTSVAFGAPRPDVLSANVAAGAGRVELVGSSPAGSVRSGEFWIDHETSLSASARGRALLAQINTGRSSGSWDIDGWADVMTAFCSHVQDLPPPVLAGGRARDDDGAEIPEFDARAAFGDGGQLPNAPPAVPGGDILGLRGSLHAALLRWFHGYIDEDDDGDPEPPSKPTPAGGTPTSPQTPEPERPDHQPPSERQLRRAIEVLESVVSAMTDANYLELREAVHLRADLGIASTLLRVALRERWIDATSFFIQTEKAWHSLFLASSKDPRRGWVQVRHDEARDPEAFREELRSPRLAAALAAWVLAAPTTPGPQQTRFRLAQCLLVARVPWMWDSRDPEAIAGELAAELRVSGWTEDEIRSRWDVVRSHWSLITAGGLALAQFESALGLFDASELRSAVRAHDDRSDPQRGDLCWQGRLGFCVVVNTESTERVEVLSLARLDAESTTLGRAYVLPVEVLLEVVPIDNGPKAATRRLLRDWITST